ncbi:MAG TPA: hypothetical protein VN843_03180, partial [Anaerolineales bacterium]|nr:hypothetical protein [Anaerolineales bacterium]
GAGADEESSKIKGRMGSTHPSKLLMAQEEVGNASYFFVRRTFGAKANGFDQVRASQSFP